MHTREPHRQIPPFRKELFGAAAGVTILQEYKNSGKVLKPASQKIGFRNGNAYLAQENSRLCQTAQLQFPDRIFQILLQLNFLPQKDNPAFFTVNFPYLPGRSTKSILQGSQPPFQLPLNSEESVYLSPGLLLLLFHQKLEAPDVPLFKKQGYTL